MQEYCNLYFVLLLLLIVMTIKQIYNLAIEMGVIADPRGKAGVKKWLEREKKIYNKLSKEEKVFFDLERLTNPYSDSRLHYGALDQQVKTVLAGIEIGEAEIALISSLNIKPDLIIIHHPVGKAYAAITEVMSMQADIVASYGVPINVAEGIMRDRIEKVGRLISPINHMRSVDAAKLAKIAYLNIHTPCDNLVSDFLGQLMTKKGPETIGEIIEILREIPEYKSATFNNAGPMVFAGNPENQAGKIVPFDITGGVEGAKEIYPELACAGVGTIIGMHMKEENRDEAIKNHLNVVIAGHISSDSIGMNLFLDRLEKKDITIITCGGLIRVVRK